MRRIGLSTLFIGLTILAGNTGACLVDAEFTHSFPADAKNSRFKFKFNLTSDDCMKYRCEGAIYFRIHYDSKRRTSHSPSAVASYSIPAGRKSIEIVTENSPSLSDGIQVRDVEISDVTCRQ